MVGSLRWQCIVTETVVVSHIPSWQNSGGELYTMVPDIHVDTVGTYNVATGQPPAQCPATHPICRTTRPTKTRTGCPTSLNNTSMVQTKGKLTPMRTAWMTTLKCAVPECFTTRLTLFAGGQFATDIRARGASPLKKDVFVEVDYDRKLNSNGTISMTTYPSEVLREQITAFYEDLDILNPGSNSG